MESLTKWQSSDSYLQILKAALDEALTPFLRVQENCGPMLDMVLRSVIVQSAAFQETAPSLARADITYQLNEIEVRNCL